MTPDPYPPGTAVRVVRPDPERRPGLKGQVGVIESAIWREPRPKPRPKPDQKPEPEEPGHWLIWVVFEKATWEGWRERGETDEVRGMYEREIEVIKP